MVSTEEGISIAELCVYVPIFILTVVVVIQHGFRKQFGCIYLAVFCVIRLAGAAFMIESVHHPTNTTDTEWSAILQSVGLSPLLLASMGLLKRVTDEVSYHTRSDGQFLPGGVIGKIITNRATANSRRSRLIQIAQLPTMIALILCIVGGIDESHFIPSEISTGKKYTKIGVILFLVIYLLLTTLVVVTMKDFRNATKGEKRVYFAVVGATPLLGVRLLWSLLPAFSNNPTFSIMSGKLLVQFFMATLEEFVIVVLYTVAGLTIAA